MKKEDNFLTSYQLKSPYGYYRPKLSMRLYTAKNQLFSQYLIIGFVSLNPQMVEIMKNKQRRSRLRMRSPHYKVRMSKTSIHLQ